MSVRLVSAVHDITEGGEFQFTCTVDTTETSIPLEYDVIIKGDSDGEKYSRYCKLALLRIHVHT